LVELLESREPIANRQLARHRFKRKDLKTYCYSYSKHIRKGHSKGRDEQGKRNETEIEL
jgi:hypothetical protein